MPNQELADAIARHDRLEAQRVGHPTSATELRQLSSTDNTYDNTLLRVRNAKGEDISGKHFDPSNAIALRSDCTSAEEASQRGDLIGIVRRATSSEFHNPTPQPPIRLTEDKKYKRSVGLRSLVQLTEDRKPKNSPGLKQRLKKIFRN